MNIIEKTKSIINECPNISSFSNGIHIDYTENVNGQYGIYSTNDAIIKEDIFGGQLRRHSFILYANNQSYTDYDRLNNSTFLLEMGYWLETQKGATVDITDTKTGKITKMYSSNAMVFDVIGDDINDGCTYQVQIYVEYYVEEPPVNTPQPEPPEPDLTLHNVTYSNGALTVDGPCRIVYLPQHSGNLRIDSIGIGTTTVTVPRGTNRIRIGSDNITGPVNICGTVVSPEPGTQSISYIFEFNTIEPIHSLTQVTLENNVYTLDGWCTITYMDENDTVISTEEHAGGPDTSTIPTGAAKISVRIDPAYTDCVFCGTTYRYKLSDGYINIVSNI